MKGDKERNLGSQPIIEILAGENLKPHDLVVSSTEQVTHKMISRACKGRRLKPKVKLKVLNALNNTCSKNYKLSDLFNY